MAGIRSSSRKIDTVFVAGVFLLFAITILLVVLIAARQYQQTASVMEQGNEVRTAEAYLRQVISQHDKENAITVTTFDDISALCFTETIDDTDYVTYVYCYDGYLRELFMEADADISPADGSAIVAAEDLSVSQAKDNLLTLTYTDTDQLSHTLYVGLHASQKGGN